MSRAAPSGSPVALDRSSPVPLYFQVATRLQKLIESGEMPVGGRMENEVDLADRLGVSRPTMRRAIQYLVERGMLVRKRGVGTQIVHPKVRRPVELSSLYDDLVEAGQRAASPRCSTSASAPPPRGWPSGTACRPGLEVTWIERLRYAGGEPLALMHNAIPRRCCSLDRRRPGRPRPLRAAAARPGHVPRMATQVVGARAANAAEARVLHENRGAPLLTMSRTAWDEMGEAVEVRLPRVPRQPLLVRAEPHGLIRRVVNPSPNGYSRCRGVLT